MTDNQDSSFPKKLITTRKRLTDLRAVASLLDEQDPNEPQKNMRPSMQPNKNEPIPFKPNEDLIQATSRIRSQRDLITQRTQKMEQNREKVSRTVYEKVRRDYMLQLENINKLLLEKKALLNRELSNLYMLREKQNMESNRHKEILEEARFRHYLEEFTEDQYKEVEDFESREINRLQSELAQIQAYIKAHEELLDPEDLGLSREPQNADVTKTMVPPKPTATPQTVQTPPPATYRLAPQTQDDWSEKTPVPERMEEPKMGKKVETKKENTYLPNLPLLSDEEPAKAPLSNVYGQSGEPDYFSTSEPAQLSKPVIPAEKIVRHDENTHDMGKLDTGKTLLHDKEPEPFSIRDVVEEAPPSEEKSSPESPEFRSSVTPTVNTAARMVAAHEQAASPSSAPGYKLVFTATENDLDFKEFVLKDDNISIGRSPSNDLVLKAPKVSRQHAAINKYKDQYLIIDLKSSNGVFVNSQKIDEYNLNDGDEISIGGYKMIFKKG